MSNSYMLLEEKIKNVSEAPDRYLNQISDFINFIMYQISISRNMNSTVSTVGSSTSAINIDNVGRRRVEERQMAAIDSAFGLWADHDNDVSVDETVRQMRRGRQFDI